jgi:hypothetical protein
MYRYKTIIGHSLHARTLFNQWIEADRMQCAEQDDQPRHTLSVCVKQLSRPEEKIRPKMDSRTNA